MNEKSSKCVLVFIVIVMNVNVVLSRLYINTRDSWFSHQQKKIAWIVSEPSGCVLPLNSTLSLIDRGNSGQVVKRISTGANNISIDSRDFDIPTYFYTLQASGSLCGLSYLFRIPLSGKCLQVELILSYIHCQWHMEQYSYA